jgi:hypothetical protein
MRREEEGGGGRRGEDEGGGGRRGEDEGGGGRRGEDEKGGRHAVRGGSNLRGAAVHRAARLAIVEREHRLDVAAQVEVECNT